MELAARKDVPVEETWDLSLIFPDEKTMWDTLEQLKEKVKTFAAEYAGKMNTAENIVRCLDEMEQLLITAGKLWSYAGLAMEADYTDNALREREAKVADAMTRLESDISFVDSEILEAPQEELEKAVTLAQGCRRYIQDLIAKKAHRLSAETEKVLTSLSRSLDVPYDIYNTMKLADISFDSFTAEGKEYPLGYSLFEDDYELEADVRVRRAAFRALETSSAA